MQFSKVFLPQSATEQGRQGIARAIKASLQPISLAACGHPHHVGNKDGVKTSRCSMVTRQSRLLCGHDTEQTVLLHAVEYVASYYLEYDKAKALRDFFDKTYTQVVKADSCSAALGVMMRTTSGVVRIKVQDALRQKDFHPDIPASVDVDFARALAVRNQSVAGLAKRELFHCLDESLTLVITDELSLDDKITLVRARVDELLKLKY